MTIERLKILTDKVYSNEFNAIIGMVLSLFFHLFPSQYVLSFSHEIDVSIVVDKIEIKKSAYIYLNS